MSAISITAANVLSSGEAGGAVIKTGILAAGVTCTAGQALSKDAAGKLTLCDGDVSLLAATFEGIALAGGSPGQTVPHCKSDPSFTLGGTIAAGIAVFTSPTAGGITSTPADNTTGMFVTFLGIGIGSNKINLSPVPSGVAAA